MHAHVICGHFSMQMIECVCAHVCVRACACTDDEQGMMNDCRQVVMIDSLVIVVLHKLLKLFNIAHRLQVVLYVLQHSEVV